MKRAAIFFSLFIALTVILADIGRLPRFVTFWVNGISYGDKIGHFVLFGLLNFFINRAVLSAFPARHPLKIVLAANLILVLFVAGEEYSQNYFSERTAEWVDLFASYAGMLGGAFIAFKQRAIG